MGACGSSEPAASVSCDRVLDPGGEPASFVASLEEGETGCLEGGETYGTSETISIGRPGVTLTSSTEERATLQGQLRVEPEADGATIENLILDGRNTGDDLGPLIYADDVVLRGNDISNDNTAICVHLASYPGEDPPTGVLIEGNEIHNCGRLPARNHDHGIYVADAVGTVIRGNLIYENADRGIQLYPDADETEVVGNVIVGNGQGVIFGGDDDGTSDDNVVTGNVIADSTIRYNVSSSWQGPTGSGNVVRGNCVWADGEEYRGVPDGSGIENPMSGAVATDNVVADPGFGDGYEVDPEGECGQILSAAAD